MAGKRIEGKVGLKEIYFATSGKSVMKAIKTATLFSATPKDQIRMNLGMNIYP
jgi:superfamily I DNA and RNA helicase